jgi:hypothetical protein
VFAQNDSLSLLSIDNTFSMQFPTKFREEQSDLRQLKEGKSNGIIYSLFISDEYKYTRITNGLQLDSLYDVIVYNTLQVYAGNEIESSSYAAKSGELRGKYLFVQSLKKTNPYLAEYYIYCVNGRIFLFSATYLANYSQEQINQAKNFAESIKFNSKLGYTDQLSIF